MFGSCAQIQSLSSKTLKWNTAKYRKYDICAAQQKSLTKVKLCLQLKLQSPVLCTQGAVRYRRNVGSLSIDMSADCRTTTLGRHIDRRIGRVSAEISADISVDMSVNMSTDTSRPIYRPSVGRHIDRHIGRASVDMSTDTRTDMSVDISTDISVEGCAKIHMKNWNQSRQSFCKRILAAMLIFITFFTSSKHLCFLSTKKRKRCDEKHGKTVTSITWPKDRLPEIFKMYAWFFIYSSVHLFQVQLASLKRMEIWQTLRFTNIHETSMALTTVPT